MWGGLRSAGRGAQTWSRQQTKSSSLLCSRLPRTGLGQELERQRLVRLQRGCDVATHTHIYSTYTPSRHNTLTSVGTVRDGEGLELHVTAASDCRPSKSSLCERDRRGEGL